MYLYVREKSLSEAISTTATCTVIQLTVKQYLFYVAIFHFLVASKIKILYITYLKTFVHDKNFLFLKVCFKMPFTAKCRYTEIVFGYLIQQFLKTEHQN